MENLALMAEFLGLNAPTQLAMSSELKRLRTIELLGAWTLALSELQPLVLLLEDLHWCDPSSLELLGSSDRAESDRESDVARHGASQSSRRRGPQASN